jgi:hypothetical protein
MFIHVETGVKHFGKVDAVPGLCHVATRFYHVTDLPLIPLGSEIIFTESAADGRSWLRCRKTTLSLKSVLVAWARAALYLTAFFGAPAYAFIIAHAWHHKRQAVTLADVLIIFGMVAGSILGIWLTHQLTRAGYDRAVQLCAELGLDPTVVEPFLNVSRKERKASAAAPEKEPEGWERYS